jgi:hypothetical protein
MAGQRSKSDKRGVETAQPTRAVAVLALAFTVAARAAQAADAIVADDVWVSVSGAGVAIPASGEVRGVELTIETTGDQAAAAHGYRSMASTVDIDCSGGRDRVRSARAFEGAHLAGPSRPRPVSGQWVRPNPEAYLAKVIGQVCASEGMPPARSAPQAAAAPRRPAEEMSRASVTATPATRLAASLTAPASASPPSRAAGAGDVRAAMLQRTATASQVAAGGRYRAQLASSDSRPAAQAVLDRLGAQIRPPLAGEVQVANVRRRTVYRSIVVNFATSVDAQAFCTRMKSAGRDCLVWSEAAE